MNMLKQFLLVLISLVVLAACLDTIELDVPSGGITDIAIDGKLVYGEPSTLEVSVSELFDYDGIPNRISVRYVELVDENENSTRVISQDKGVYSKDIFSNDPDISISPDKNYKVRILLANGDMIESNFQNLKRVPRNNNLRQESFRKLIEDDDGQILDRLAIRFIAENEVPSDKTTKLKLDVLRTYKFSNLNLGSLRSEVGFCLTAGVRRVGICDLLKAEPNNPAGLFDCDNGGVSNAIECDQGTNPLDSLDDGLPTLEARSCYITGFENITNLKLYDPAKDQSGNSVYVQDLFEPSIDFKFAEGYHIQVITETLNEATYNYFDKIEEIISLTGSMFDPPAGRVSGNMINITNEESLVYGFFYVTEQDTVNSFVEPDREIQDFFCLRDFMGMPPETCDDCTVWGNQGDDVTVIRPDFWPKN